MLEARTQIIVSSTHGQRETTNSNEAKETLDALKMTLDAQEASLKKARKMLHEREVYLEECENAIVEQSMILTDREARMEQSEEDFATSIISINTSSSAIKTD